MIAFAAEGLEIKADIRTVRVGKTLLDRQEIKKEYKIIILFFCGIKRRSRKVLSVRTRP